MVSGRDRINLNNSIPCVVLQKVVEKWSQDMTELILIIAFPVLFTEGRREMESGRDRINLNNSIPCVVLRKVVEKWSWYVTELILIIAFPVLFYRRS